MTDKEKKRTQCKLHQVDMITTAETPRKITLEKVGGMTTLQSLKTQTLLLLDSGVSIYFHMRHHSEHEVSNIHVQAKEIHSQITKSYQKIDACVCFRVFKTFGRDVPHQHPNCSICKDIYTYSLVHI